MLIYTADKREFVEHVQRNEIMSLAGLLPSMQSRYFGLSR
jgi:hypothetical protein